VPPNFYNQGDQAIYSAGDFFIPQERFRAAPYSVNKPNNPDEVPAGIPTVYQPQGGSGGGGYTGGISDLTGNFFQTTSDRQDRLTELNYPYQDGNVFFPGQKGAEITMETLAPVGAPKNLYEGTIEGIPQTIKGAPGIVDIQPASLNRKIQEKFYDLPFLSKPQSADQIIEEGYTPGIKLGILSNLLPDKYGELPRGDQAFIARNMGYTGPTVFGANDSGLSKDVFGLNTRSGFGNYAEAVGEQVDSLGESLSGRLSDKYGATFNAATGMFESEDEEAAAKANKMTKMMRAKYNFYQKQVAQRDADRKAAEEARMKAYQESQMKKERDIIQSRLDNTGVTGSNYNQAANISGGGGGNQVINTPAGPMTARQATYDNNPNTGTKQGYSQHYMDGGRVYYMDGGLADMLEIYD